MTPVTTLNSKKQERTVQQVCTTPYWTVEQVAEYLSLSKKTIWQYAREGILPCYRIGNKYRFKPQEIESWMRQHRHKTVLHADQVIE